MQYKFDKPVHGIIGNEKYQSAIEWHNGKFIADESATSGGKDSTLDFGILIKFTFMQIYKMWKCY